MGIIKGFDKIFGGLNKGKTKEDTELLSFADNLRIDVEGERIGESDDGVLFINFQELGGFEFMNLMIASRFNIRTKNKCELHFVGSTNLELVSDDEEIESDNSNPAKIWITTMSFDISKDQIKYIKSKVADEIKIKYKKKELCFNGIK